MVPAQSNVTSVAPQNDAALERPPRRFRQIRWWVCGLLFASTVINYLDRQSLALLAPSLKRLFRWDNSDYADLVIGFRVAYTVGQVLWGRLLDRVGTRKGATITVALYSVASILTPLANGLRSFLSFRCLLGLGESGNWPAATKAVSEWFPGRERGLATAFFDSGSSLGGALAPFLIFWIYAHWGWRPAFVVPGLLGAVWLLVWRWFYHPPEQHPMISAEELSMLQGEQRASGTHQSKERIPLKALLRLKETWGAIVARAFTDPVWFFITDWFPIYLVSKGFALRSSLLAVWVPFLAADAGSYVGGLLSGWLIRWGWSLLPARKAIVMAGGLGTLCLIPTIFVDNLFAITALFGISTFSYSAFSVMANVLPSDLYQPEGVATVSGLAGTVAGIGTILGYKAIGYFSDARRAAGIHAFDPVMVVCGLVPFVGALLVLGLIRPQRSSSNALKSV